MIVRKPGHLHFWTLTPEPSPPSTPVLAATTDLDVTIMSRDDYESPNPLSVSIPQTYTPPPPMLDDVLSNNAPPPYTLSAFTAFLSHNHCLETLEFTMEAVKYQDYYKQVVVQFAGAPVPASSQEGEHLQLLWRKLLSAYIVQGSPREVNLPSEERDQLLHFPYTSIPPPPQVLDTAIRRIRDLMQESIFLPFLNSFSAPTYNPELSYDYPEADYASNIRHSKSRRQRSPRRRTPPSSVLGLDASSTRSPPSLRPLSSNISAALSGRSNRMSIHHSSSPSVGSASTTDDTGSLSSSLEPMTPPTTPPSSDLGHSPRNSRGESKSTDTWKKMGMKLGWKKRSSTTLKSLPDE